MHRLATKLDNHLLVLTGDFIWRRRCGARLVKFPKKISLPCVEGPREHGTLHATVGSGFAIPSRTAAKAVLRRGVAQVVWDPPGPRTEMQVSRHDSGR